MGAISAVSEVTELSIGAEEAGERLDKALARLLPEMSRARLQALIAAGQVRALPSGATIEDASRKVKAGERFGISVPPPEPATPQGEDLGLDILFEDDHLIVVNKPAGLVVHPAPGHSGGTLVNALLHHCGDSLGGIGGVARPGIVHRLDKDTSGVMVAAKTDAAHRGLVKLFAAHDIDRAYMAFVRGAPPQLSGTVESLIGRSPRNRQKMAVLTKGGREAITHWQLAERFGPPVKPLAARLDVTLETGRTHQIRVHLAHSGVPVLGDALYGTGVKTKALEHALAGLNRHALHAYRLGFRHPVTTKVLSFETKLPPDLVALSNALKGL